MPPAVRRLASIAAVALGALASAAPALADNAGLTPVDPEVAECRGDQRHVLPPARCHGRRLLRGRDRARRLSDQVPPPQPAGRRRGPADPRQHAARGAVDDRARVPRRDRRRVRLLQAARGHRRHASSERAGRRAEPRDRRRGPALLLGVQVPRRTRHVRHDGRPGRPDRRAERDGSRLRRDPLVVDSGARRKDRRDSREAQPHLVPRRVERRLRGQLHRVLRPAARRDDDDRARRGRRRIRSRARAPRREWTGAVRGDLREVPQPAWPAARRPDARRQPDARRP